MKGVKKVVDLSLNQTIGIDSLLEGFEGNLTFQNIINELEFYLSKHFFQFGNKPYSIEYAPLKGYILRASSLVGKISTDNFEIILNPKFQNLTFGKCLALAQYSNSSLLNISSNNLTKSIISTKYDYSTTDYLGFGLIDAVNTIFNNGLARTFKEVINESVKIRGSIALSETVTSGKLLINPYIYESEADYNIYPNQLIKVALNIILDKTLNVELKSTSYTFLDKLKDVSIVNFDINAINHFKHIFSLPRLDYEKAILYSISIIEGGLLGEEGKAIDLPSITLDLDQVFEQYIANALSRLLVKDRFSVDAQVKFNHPIYPTLSNKAIIPDVLIRDTEKDVSFVIDTKNKYSELVNGVFVNLSNSDIFQITYYCNALGIKIAVLLYPSVKPQFQFPIKGSESDKAFAQKCDIAFGKLKASQYFTIFETNQVILLVYHIDLGGSVFNTERSVASFCQLLLHISENEYTN